MCWNMKRQANPRMSPFFFPALSPEDKYERGALRPPAMGVLSMPHTQHPGLDLLAGWLRLGVAVPVSKWEVAILMRLLNCLRSMRISIDTSQKVGAPNVVNVICLGGEARSATVNCFIFLSRLRGLSIPVSRHRQMRAAPPSRAIAFLSAMLSALHRNPPVDSPPTRNRCVIQMYRKLPEKATTWPMCARVFV